MTGTLCKTLSTYITVFYIRITFATITVIWMSGHMMMLYFKMCM